jgi:GDSL-like lipase/acylhydrolase family protein
MRGMTVVVLFGVAMALALAASAEASPGSPRTAIVSLGDSFISGEGGRWLGNGSEPFGTRSGTDRAATNCDGWGICDYDPELVYGTSEQSGCHRSDVAPIASAPAPVGEKVNLACSGAKVENLWPAAMGGQSHFGQLPQTDALGEVAQRDDVKLVVVTAGANDVGFGELVAARALDWARSSKQDPAFCRSGAQADVDAALPAMERGLRRALAGVQWVLASEGYGHSDYRLAVMGYASPLPAGRWIRYPEEGWSRLNRGGCPIWNADADWAAREATPTIDAAMRRAATAAGAEFLDVQHALDGHQLCDSRASRVGPAGPSPLQSEWVRRLAFVQGSSRESLHPNAYGQRALGACISLLYADGPGDYACRAEPGHSYVDGMRIGQLR